MTFSTNNSVINPAIAQKSTLRLTMGLIVFSTGILYYCFAYLLRIYPSVIEDQILNHFTITAGAFGILTSFYYFAYAPMQLPVGVTVDRLGSRKSLLFACSIAMSGALIFALSRNYYFALIGRFLIGLGAAFAYVTALKIASVWLPRRYFATATGVVTGLGMISAICTDIYMTHLVETTNFVTTLLFPVVIGAVLFVLIFFLVKDPQTLDENSDSSFMDSESQGLSYLQLASRLKKLLNNPQMWIIGAVGALMYLPASVFLDVWAIPYLRTAYHLSPEQAALAVSITLTGWICSSFIMGFLSDYLGTRKKPLTLSAFSACAVSALILYYPGINSFLLYFLLFLFGVLCGPHPLCFTLSKENNPRNISGTSVAFANFIIMMGGFIFQPVVGKILDYLWDGSINTNIPLYSPLDYKIALLIMPCGLFIAGMLTLLIKETFQENSSY